MYATTYPKNESVNFRVLKVSDAYLIHASSLSFPLPCPVLHPPPSPCLSPALFQKGCSRVDPLAHLPLVRPSDGDVAAAAAAAAATQAGREGGQDGKPAAAGGDCARGC